MSIVGRESHQEAARARQALCQSLFSGWSPRMRASLISATDGAALVLDHREYHGSTIITVSGAVAKDVGVLGDQLPRTTTHSGPVIVDLDAATLLHRAGFQQLMFELEVFSGERRLLLVCRRPSALRLLRSWQVDRMAPLFLTVEGALEGSPGPLESGGGPAVGPGPDPHGHVVEFYESDQFLVESVQEFLAPALRQEDAVVVVATEAHRDLFEAALGSAGLDVESARAAGRYTALDAEATLSKFMLHGAPDRARFEASIGGLIAEAAGHGRKVRVYGEMVAVLFEAGNVSAAIALEDLWNELGRSRRFRLFCAYPLAGFDGVTSTGPFHTICDQHTSVIPTERYSNLEAEQRVRAVALMQQEAAAALRERARLEARVRDLEELATTDPLTGLPNRLCFLDRLEQALAVARRKTWDVAVLFLDFDRFKDVNDSLGHRSGDQLLIEVSDRLRRVLRESDTLARFGGDEFAVLLSGPTSPDEATAAAQRVVESFRTAFSAGGAAVSVSCSVGVSIRSDGADSPADLLQNADVAMYRAKDAGGDCFAVFEPAC